MATIERVEAPSVARFRRDFLGKNRPVVLRGVTDHWRSRAWTRELLADRIGDLPLPNVFRLDDGHVRVDMESGLGVDPMPFREYLDRSAEPGVPKRYLRLELKGPFAKLKRDFETPPYCVRSLAMKISLWVGNPGTVSGLHYDLVHNISAPMKGRRRVTLFAPKDTKRLYPQPLRTLHWHHSRVCVDNPDLAAFPRFSEASREVVELEPGEAMFIPKGWWHSFETLEPSITLNFFWLTPRLAPGAVVARLLWSAARVQT